MDLTNLGAKQAWDYMDNQNKEILGESLGETMDMVEYLGEDYYFSKLPQPLQNWTELNMDQQTELWQTIQGVGMDIYGLLWEFKKSKEFKELDNTYNLDLTTHMAWAWHLLYSEQ